MQVNSLPFHSGLTECFDSAFHPQWLPFTLFVHCIWRRPPRHYLPQSLNGAALSFLPPSLKREEQRERGRASESHRSAAIVERPCTLPFIVFYLVSQAGRTLVAMASPAHWQCHFSPCLMISWLIACSSASLVLMRSREDIWILHHKPWHSWRFVHKWYKQHFTLDYTYYTLRLKSPYRMKHVLSSDRLGKIQFAFF